MGANDSNSPNFKMKNPESGQTETYAKNPSYLQRAIENVTLSAGHGDRVNQARAEYQKLSQKNIPAGDAKDAD